jgi:large subunit ribosomal protein L4e
MTEMMIMAKANVFGTDGSNKGSVELPSVFETQYKPQLIQRAVLAIQTAQKQPKGTDPRAGKKNTARYRGYRGVPTPHRIINTENARLPRLTNRRYLLYGRTAFVPHVVGGRAAHPLKSWETIVEGINKKEKRLALQSAIAATANKELVSKRFIVEGALPIVVEDAFEDIAKTQKVLEVFEKIGVAKDIENAKDKVRKRAGKGKARGRVWKDKKSVLVVTGKNSPILKAVRNIPGVESVTVNSLNVELVAPGAEAGRLVVYTKSAIEELGKERTAPVAKAEVKKEAKKEVKTESKKEKDPVKKVAKK